MTEEPPVYPFTAIVGQENMKDALLANIVYPSIGGVLIRGEKGTAKSTAVRAIADLLPRRRVVRGCPFQCDFGDRANLCTSCQERLTQGECLEPATVRMRVVELPLSATEDRVVGTLDIEHAITRGKKKFEPGVLAYANGNILYVDEVNLLDDHIVDLLLDAAAMGMNFVEREGISYSHPSRFMLVGTMNPEEGDLRPQLLDRFGLAVDVEGERDPGRRAEIVRRRLAFERDPAAFCRGYEAQQEEARQRIERAKELAREIEPDDRLLRTAVQISLTLGVDGHRSDLTMVRGAIAFAALDGRNQVGEEDVISAARLSLPHRMRRRPFEEGHMELGKIRSFIADQYGGS